MTKAILEFELPEDNSDFILARNGSLYYSYLWDIADELRQLRKYRPLEENQDKIIEHIETFFYNTIGNALEEVE